MEKSFGCVVISSPDLKVGETYTVSCGGSSTSVEVTGTIVGSGMGGFGGRMGGMNGQGFGGRGGQSGTGEATPGGDFQPGELPEGTSDGQFPGGQGGMRGPQGGGRGHGGQGGQSGNGN